MNGKFLEAIKNIKQKYISYGIAEKEIILIVRSYLQNIPKEETTKEEFINKLICDVTKLLNEYIINEIENSNYSSAIFFTNNTLSEKQTKKNSIAELNKIRDYCQEIGIISDIDFYNELISQCQIVKDLISVIIAGHVEDIENNNISKITKNNFVKELIEAYCVSSSLISNYELIELPEDSNLPMATDPFRQYMSEIKKKPFSPEEEKEAWIKIKNGDKSAKEDFVERNLLLVISIAKRYYNSCLDQLDLVQEGNVGLLKAIEKYDPDKGNKFSTYATWWIRQSITRAISDKGRVVRIPVHQHQKIAKYKNAISELQGELSAYPTRKQIRERLGWTEEELKRIEIDAQEVSSLNQLVGGEDNETELLEFIESEDFNPEEEYLHNNHNREIILMFIRSSLTKKEMFVISKRFGIDDGIPKTLERVAPLLGVTRERIRQIEAKALKKLKASQEAAALYKNSEIINFVGLNKKIDLTPEDQEGYQRVTDDVLDRLIDTMWNPRYNCITNGATPFRNSLILGLRYGAVDGKKHSIPAIASLFNLDYGTIKDILFKTSTRLINEYNKINQENKISYEEYETSLTKLLTKGQ